MGSSEVDEWDLFLQINLRLTKLEKLLETFLFDKEHLRIENKKPLDMEKGSLIFEDASLEGLYRLHSELSCLLQPLLDKHVSRLSEIKSNSAKLIYFVLLMLGPKHPSYFWRRLKMSRSTVHKSIKMLKEKGLVLIDDCVVKVKEELK